jgi:hypothetical protein
MLAKQRVNQKWRQNKKTLNESAKKKKNELAVAIKTALKRVGTRAST